MFYWGAGLKKMFYCLGILVIQIALSSAILRCYIILYVISIIIFLFLLCL